MKRPKPSKPHIEPTDNFESFLFCGVILCSLISIVLVICLIYKEIL